MEKDLKTIFSITLILTGFGFSAVAVETAGEKVNTAANKTIDNVKEAGRNAQDKTCEMINGKMQCLGKKIKHKVRTASDKTKTKAEEVKDKLDK